MKRKGMSWMGGVMLLAIIVIAACTDKTVGPVLNANWAAKSAPVFINEQHAASFTLVATQADSLLESLTWKAPDYGTGTTLPTNYVIQVSQDSTFKDKVAVLTTTGGTTFTPTVSQLDAAALTAGAPAFAPTKIYLRIQASLVASPADTVFSDFIRRDLTLYRASDCGTYCAFSIIGDGTPGDWAVDTDMQLSDPTHVDKHKWVVTLFLKGGKAAKFRTSHDWGTNFGGSSFSSGTGVLNGDNISIPNDGYYKVTFDDETKAYAFSPVSTPTYAKLSVIGSATPHGWDSDTELTVSGTNAHWWTGTVALVNGEAKFRTNDDWGTNWGGTTFPSGAGLPGGANIPVAIAGGSYGISFNDATATYYFGLNSVTPVNSMGIIGAATSHGWDADTPMIANPNDPYLFSTFITLTDGDVKFRANGAWDINWGGNWSSAVGVPGGGNIPAKAGTYFVTINTLTGEYSFLK